MFTPDFETCLDACASWTKSMRAVMGEDNTNTTCAGAHFVPLWSNKTEAYKHNARGNCFLARGPQTREGLRASTKGSPCHSGIMVEG